jgi:hypothetical protein
MKSIVFSPAVAVLFFCTIAVKAQVPPVPDAALPPGQVVPAVPPAAPVAPTAGGERRAIQREERRIDRNDPNANLAPIVQPDGAVTTVPNVPSNVGVPPSAIPYNGGYTTRYRGTNRTYYARPYRRGLFGRRFYY